MTFHLYGFFVGLGILVGAWISERLGKKFSIFNFQFSIYEALPWVLIPGIIGARLYHVVDWWQYYSKNLEKIFYVWEGGLGIYGGIMGGIVGLFSYSVLVSWQELKDQFSIFNFQFSKTLITQLLNYSTANFLNLADLAAFGLPVGQAIGRIGNYFNQELYGLPTNLPWGIYIKPANRLAGFESFEYFHPLFAYEAIWSLIIFITIIIFIKVIKGYKRGSLFFTYLGLYSFGRFWLEFLRLEAWVIFGVNVAQAVSLSLFIFALFWLIYYSIYKYIPNNKNRGEERRKIC